MLPFVFVDASTIRKSVMPISLGKLAVKDAEIFSVPFHSAKQMRHFKFSSLSFLATLLSGNKFIAQVTEAVPCGGALPTIFVCLDNNQ